MTRRAEQGDQEFGSDSFLDIIANIVGILIILIVIAGLKVARQPELLSGGAADTFEAAQPENTVTPAVEQPKMIGLPDWNAVPTGQLVLREVPPEESGRLLEAEVGHSKAIADEVKLKAYLISLQKTPSDVDDDEQPQVSAELERVSTTIDSLRSAVADAGKKTGEAKRSLVALHKREQYVDSALRQIDIETRRLREVLESNAREQEKAEARRDTLTHRLSPVGRSVSEGEMHFRLHDGQVAHIPIDRLVDRMTEQIKGRQRLVMKFRRYEGVVGPLDGFVMKYVVQRQVMSPLQAMQYGRNSYRFSVSRWTIEPADTYRGESVDMALKRGSQFRQLIETAEPDSTVTIWLYPNEFQHFGRLRELAHSLNLRVAARPLPEGTPVAGSPNGSQSTSQ